jgi:hypothetical protein
MSYDSIHGYRTRTLPQITAVDSENPQLPGKDRQSPSSYRPLRPPATPRQPVRQSARSRPRQRAHHRAQQHSIESTFHLNADAARKPHSQTLLCRRRGNRYQRQRRCVSRRLDPSPPARHLRIAHPMLPAPSQHRHSAATPTFDLFRPSHPCLSRVARPVPSHRIDSDQISVPTLSPTSFPNGRWNCPDRYRNLVRMHFEPLVKLRQRLVTADRRQRHLRLERC